MTDATPVEVKPIDAKATTDLTDKLHDEIDVKDEAYNDALDIVSQTIRDHLQQAIDETGDIGGAMLWLAHKVEENLVNLTTKTVRQVAEARRAFLEVQK